MNNSIKWIPNINLMFLSKYHKKCTSTTEDCKKNITYFRYLQKKNFLRLLNTQRETNFNGIVLFNLWFMTNILYHITLSKKNIYTNLIRMLNAGMLRAWDHYCSLQCCICICTCFFLLFKKKNYRNYKKK